MHHQYISKYLLHHTLEKKNNLQYKQVEAQARNATAIRRIAVRELYHGAQLNAPLKPPVSHSNIILRSVKGPPIGRPLCRETLSDIRFEFSRLGKASKPRIVNKIFRNNVKASKPRIVNEMFRNLVASFNMPTRLLRPH